MTREELQRLYSECVSRAFRAEQLAGLVRGVESFLAEPDPTVEIAYLKAKLADLSDEYPTRRTQGRRPPMSHDDIKAALESRTDLPWRPSHDGPVATRPSDTYDVLDNDGETVAASLFYLDAHLIANAPTWLAELLAEVDEAQAEAMNVGHDYDRRGERLWRLAALAGWTPGNEADNDATAESYVRERLAEVDRLSHWKAEALPVIDGLQELGAELGIRLGGRITGPDALAAVKALAARAEAAEQAIQRVRGMAEAWATQPTDYDEDTEQQIEDGRAILRALDGGER